MLGAERGLEDPGGILEVDEAKRVAALLCAARDGDDMLVRERERGRERECVCVREIERERKREREREKTRERERECVRERAR